MSMGKSAAILFLALALQGCYTRLYRGDEELYAGADSLAFREDSLAGEGGQRYRDTVIYRYHEPRYYRGYPYWEWYDPFFDPLRRPRLRGYWDYYYDPYWGYRRPYRYYRPHRPHYPQGRPPRSRPPGSGPDPSADGDGPELYEPAPRTPPPSRGRRRTDSESPAQEKSEGAPESRDTPGSSSEEEEEEKIPPPEKGRRK